VVFGDALAATSGGAEGIVGKHRKKINPVSFPSFITNGF
jgi:hypothetical protein